MDFSSLDVPFFFGTLAALLLTMAGAVLWLRRKPGRTSRAVVIVCGLLLAGWTVVILGAASLDDVNLN